MKLSQLGNVAPIGKMASEVKKTGMMKKFITTGKATGSSIFEANARPTLTKLNEIRTMKTNISVVAPPSSLILYS